MLYRKIFFFFFTGAIFLLSLFLLLNPLAAQDDGLPPMIINSQDFPFLQGQSVIMQKQLWGDKDEVAIEISMLSGTKDIQGTKSQVVKTFDTNGEFAEDYFSKDGASMMYMGTTREKIDKLVPSKHFQFPIELNSEWTVLDKEISGKKVLITSKVVSHEFVKVPAGIFQALKIAITSGFADESRVENSYIWVSPGVGIVKEIQQVDENLTQIRELMSFNPGGQSLLSVAGSIPPGGETWNGSGKANYRAFAKHPETGEVLEQNIGFSYSFSFTIDGGSGLIRGQGQANIDNYKNSWNNNSIDGNKGANFSFIGKKEGNNLNFYDGFLVENPEKFALSKGGDVFLLKILSQAFRISAPVNGQTGSASLKSGTRDGSYIDIEWQASK